MFDLFLGVHILQFLPLHIFDLDFYSWESLILLVFHAGKMALQKVLHQIIPKNCFPEDLIFQCSNNPNTDIPVDRALIS